MYKPDGAVKSSEASSKMEIMRSFHSNLHSERSGTKSRYSQGPFGIFNDEIEKIPHNVSDNEDDTEQNVSIIS